MVDVGGGRGAMLAGVLGPGPTSPVWSPTVPTWRSRPTPSSAELGLGARAHGLGCDFFESVPEGADVYFLSNVLHDWDDEDCRRILRTIRQRMSRELATGRRRAGARRPRTARPHEVRDLAFVDLHMLVMFGARERTEEEYDELLAAAGFDRRELIDTGMSWNLIAAGTRRSRRLRHAGAARRRGVPTE